MSRADKAHEGDDSVSQVSGAQVSSNGEGEGREFRGSGINWSYLAEHENSGGDEGSEKCHVH